MLRWYLSLLFFLLVVVTLAAAAPSAPPNIIIITLDTTRADRMGFLGSKSGLTPNLDELAKQGVVFTRAYAQVPLKVVGTHSGISIGEDGPSQMSIEDIALACSLPGFTVIDPADEFAMKSLVKSAAALSGRRSERPRMFPSKTVCGVSVALISTTLSRAVPLPTARHR